jgi:hypothetical protein
MAEQQQSSDVDSDSSKHSGSSGADGQPQEAEEPHKPSAEVLHAGGPHAYTPQPMHAPLSLCMTCNLSDITLATSPAAAHLRRIPRITIDERTWEGAAIQRGMSAVGVTVVVSLLLGD